MKDRKKKSPEPMTGPRKITKGKLPWPKPTLDLRPTTRQREEKENHPRTDVYLRGLVDSMVAEIVGIARMENPSKEDLEFASDQLTGKVEKFMNHLTNPPHPVGCMCSKACIDKAIEDAG